MKRAFTLIELLIVVAIIAILAAIAVPNFLEAQTRAKISRAKADMRTVATGLEAYTTDNNAYPNAHRFGIVTASDRGTVDPVGTKILERLTTPVAYLTTVLVRDPFKVAFRLAGANAQTQSTEVPTVVSEATDSAAFYNSYIYQSWNGEQRYAMPTDSFNSETLQKQSRAWLLHSAGPDSVYHNLGGVLANDRIANLPACSTFIYDATNGTVSKGSIWRTGGQASASSAYAAGEGLIAAIQGQR